MPAAAPPRRKTLIFHIGDHKTGSTSIQLAFAKQLVTLQGRSISYPAKLASNALSDQCRAYGAAATPEARQAAARPFLELAEHVQKTEADFTLVSAEALESVPAALFHEIVETFFKEAARDIRIIAYVRPHAARLTSSFAERIKIGTPQVLRSTLDGFASRKAAGKEFFYLPRFTAWQQHFGAAFTLRPMIRSQLHQGDVVSDFVHHAFGGIPFTITGDSHANESLCLEDLMRLKVLQRNLKARRNLRLKTGWEITRIISRMPPPRTRSKLQLHRALAEDTRSTYITDAREMDRMFFGGAPLMEHELHAAVEKAIPEPQSTEPADHFSASELRSLRMMARMIAGLFEEPSVDWPAFLHAKRVRDVELARQAGTAKAAE